LTVLGSDCVEVPLDLVPPPPPTISKTSPTKPSKPSQSQVSKVSAAPSKPARAASPLPENGAGDCLSVEDTNKLRAKLGLKPLDIGKSLVESSSTSRKDKKDKSDNGQKSETKEQSKYKDDLGEFYHKPAVNIAKTTAAEKIRDKIKEKKEKRAIENQLSKTKTLGESDAEDGDDIKKWVKRNRELEKSKKEAEKRARVLEEMDQVLIVLIVEIQILNNAMFGCRNSMWIPRKCISKKGRKCTGRKT
jgi:U4/U6.U5 tri-snRNP-associated protein 1